MQPGTMGSSIPPLLQNHQQNPPRQNHRLNHQINPHPISKSTNIVTHHAINNNPPSLLFLADSRGRGLDADLCDVLDESFTLAYYPGAKIRDTIDKAEIVLKNYPWKLIFCLAGICDLTVMDHTTRLVHIRDHNIQNMNELYYNSIRYAEDRISYLSPTNTQPRCIFAPVTGLDLARYNKRPNHPDDINGQLLLNEAITLVNTTVTKANSTNGVPTPWTSRIIHRRLRTSFSNYYEKLSVDGCHLSKSVRYHWAESLQNTVLKYKESS